MTKTHPLSVRRQLLDALLALLHEDGAGWPTPPQLARQAGLSLRDVVLVFPGGRPDLLRLVAEDVTDQVLDDIGADPALADEAPRGRLFHVLLGRFDAYGPWKPAFQRLWDTRSSDPLAAVAMLPNIAEAMRWMTVAADVAPPGPRGAVLAAVITGLWLKTLPDWFADDSPDLTRVMAALDRRLTQLEPWLIRAHLWPDVTPSPDTKTPASGER